MTKAIALLSGGLDSILAVKLVLEQGVEVEAVNFLTVFFHSSTSEKTYLASKTAAEKLGIKIIFFEVSKEYSDLVKKPKYGYGSNINPCVDCRIFMLKKASGYMKEVGAEFLITGEVLGERPMSQRKDAFRIIDRDSGLEGLILRPLSAKLLEPTIPEKKGLINRENLLAIKGRSRKPQIKLAKESGIDEYLQPAGGCLLTDPGFANRMKDLVKHNPDFTINDVQLLKIGRHFRLSSKAKIIVGRDKEENDELLNLAKDGDLCFYPSEIKGPTGIGRGFFDDDQIFTSCRIIARYSDGGDSDQHTEIKHERFKEGTVDSVSVFALETEKLKGYRI